MRGCRWWFSQYPGERPHQTLLWQHFCLILDLCSARWLTLSKSSDIDPDEGRFLNSQTMVQVFQHTTTFTSLDPKPFFPSLASSKPCNHSLWTPRHPSNSTDFSHIRCPQTHPELKCSILHYKGGKSGRQGTELRILTRISHNHSRWIVSGHSLVCCRRGYDLGFKLLI